MDGKVRRICGRRPGYAAGFTQAHDDDDRGRPGGLVLNRNRRGERIFSTVDLVERAYSGVQHPQDFFNKIEAHRDGKLYVGKKRYGGTCVKSGFGKTNRCVFEDQVEFTLVTPSRIEGAGLEYPADAKFDCRKCTYSKPKTILKFTWIPE